MAGWAEIHAYSSPLGRTVAATDITDNKKEAKDNINQKWRDRQSVNTTKYK